MTRTADERFEQVNAKWAEFTAAHPGPFEAGELLSFLKDRGVHLTPQQLSGVLQRMIKKNMVSGDSQPGKGIIYSPKQMKGKGMDGGKNGGGTNSGRIELPGGTGGRVLPKDFGYLSIRLHQARVVLRRKGLADQAASEQGCDLEFNGSSLQEEARSTEEKFRQRVTAFDDALAAAGLLQDFETCMALAGAIGRATDTKLLEVVSDEAAVARLKKMSAADFLLDNEDLAPVRALLEKIKPPRPAAQPKTEQPRPSLADLLKKPADKPVEKAEGAGPRVVPAASGPVIPSSTAEGGPAPAKATTAPSDAKDQQIAELQKQKVALARQLGEARKQLRARPSKADLEQATQALKAEKVVANGLAATLDCRPKPTVMVPGKILDPDVAKLIAGGESPTTTPGQLGQPNWRGVVVKTSLAVLMTAIVVGLVGWLYQMSAVSPETQAILEAAKNIKISP